MKNNKTNLVAIRNLFAACNSYHFHFKFSLTKTTDFKYIDSEVVLVDIESHIIAVIESEFLLCVFV